MTELELIAMLCYTTLVFAAGGGFGCLVGKWLSRQPEVDPDDVLPPECQ